MASPKSLPRRVIDGIERWCNLIGTSLVIVVMFLVCADVIYRTIARSSILGVIESVQMMLVAVAMLTIAYTQTKGGHVAMDSLVSRLPRKWANVMGILCLLIFLGFGVIATYSGADRALRAVRLGEATEGMVGIPSWPSRIIVAFGFFLLCIRLLVQIWDKLNPAVEVAKKDHRRETDFE